MELILSSLLLVGSVEAEVEVEGELDEEEEEEDGEGLSNPWQDQASRSAQGGKEPMQMETRFGSMVARSVDRSSAMQWW